MSWPSDRILSRALHELLARVDLGDVWTEAGPTDRARRLYDDGGGLSDGQRAMLCACFGIFNPANKKGTLGLVLHKLDTDNLDAVLSLCRACHGGNEAVEAWIARAGARRGAGPGSPVEHALLKAAIDRDPPGDDIMGWIVRAIPGAPTETVLRVWHLFLAGTFGEVESIGHEEKAYHLAQDTLRTVPARLVRPTPDAEAAR
jgi:hypothetical protein